MKNIMNKLWTGIKFIGKWLTCPVWGPFYGTYLGGSWLWTKVRGKSKDDSDVSAANDEVYTLSSMEFSTVRPEMSSRASAFMPTNEEVFVEVGEDDIEDSALTVFDDSFVPINWHDLSDVKKVFVRVSCQNLSLEDDMSDCLIIYDPDGHIEKVLARNSNHWPDDLDMVVDRIDFSEDNSYGLPTKFSCKFLKVEFYSLGAYDGFNTFAEFLYNDLELNEADTPCMYCEGDSIELWEYGNV